MALDRSNPKSLQNYREYQKQYQRQYGKTYYKHKGGAEQKKNYVERKKKSMLYNKISIIFRNILLEI